MERSRGKTGRSSCPGGVGNRTKEGEGLKQSEGALHRSCSWFDSWCNTGKCAGVLVIANMIEGKQGQG